MRKIDVYKTPVVVRAGENFRVGEQELQWNCDSEQLILAPYAILLPGNLHSAEGDGERNRISGIIIQFPVQSTTKSPGNAKYDRGGMAWRGLQ